MKPTKVALLCSAVLLFGCAAGAASAEILDITNVGVNSWNPLTISDATDPAVDGTFPATAIELTVEGAAKTLNVFCVDILHDIVVQGYSPPIQYKTGMVLTDSTGSESGTGNSLTLAQSEEIQTLANLGAYLAAAASPDANKITAAAGAIWAVEYGAKVTGSTQAESNLIASDVAYAKAHPASGYADAIYPVGANTQGFGFSQGFGTAVPEPGAWALMLAGAGLTGLVLRRQRRRVATA